MKKARAPEIPRLTHNPDTPNPYFDFMATAQGDALKALVADVAAILETRSDRQRARKATDAVNFLRGVDALVCNLVASVLERAGEPFALSLNKNQARWKRSRYHSHGLMRDTFLRIVAASDGEFLTLTKAARSPNRAQHGNASTIEPTQEFAAEVRARGIALSDLGVRREAELIAFTQKQPKEDAWRWDDQTETVFVDYRDNRFTNAARAQMQALRDRIAAASIEFVEDGEHPRVDTKRRDLQRRFILPPRCDGKAARPLPAGHTLEGGRMAGNAFWLTLRKDRRRASLRLGGEAIAEVDFNAMFPRLACAKAEHPIGGNGDSAQSDMARDFYAPIVEAVLKHSPEAPRDKLRSGIKQALSALLFAPTLRRWPEKIRARLPKQFSVEDMRRVVWEVYPALWPYVAAASSKEKRGIGYRLMRIESDLILQACLRLAAQGITALPIHDAVLVPRSKAMIAAEALERTALEVAGVVVPVSVWAGGDAETGACGRAWSACAEFLSSRLLEVFNPLLPRLALRPPLKSNQLRDRL